MKLSNIEVYWDDFVDWCEDNNISLMNDEETAEWRKFFDCWESAIGKAIENRK